jgi:hypothetical protein
LKEKIIFQLTMRTIRREFQKWRRVKMMNPVMMELLVQRMARRGNDLKRNILAVIADSFKFLMIFLTSWLVGNHITDSKLIRLKGTILPRWSE